MADVTAPGYDAFLLVSFGGPEAPADVLPFLENVTRGRGVPRERLIAVAEHYHHLGGRSPINDQCRALLSAIEAEFSATGIDLPIYWGNRNWHPMLADTMAVMAADGVQRVLAMTTSAYASYSGCRQYREDLAAARTAAGAETMRIDKVRHYFNHPGFVDPMIDSTIAAVADLPAELREGAHLMFTTHSIPLAMAEHSGPAGGSYVSQHTEVAALVAQGVAARGDASRPWKLVFQSRSGPPSVPWLEPSVEDHLRDLANAGLRAAVVVPIGFISDHVEVCYDLDIELRELADSLGVTMTRAATVGVHPAFVRAIADLVRERTDGAVRAWVGDAGPSHDLCPVGCCPNLRAPASAVAGQD
ncbi:MAG: ferrochelatase [Sporichthyaceae bacterium]